MNIYVSERLKEFRRRKKKTQEELANHLGISVQAVSKWERGESYPDITLLPSIASYYGVSIDDLFGVSKIENEKRIEEYHIKDQRLHREGKNADRVTLWREAIRDFPNEMSVISGLMLALRSTDRKKYADEIIELGERIIKESTDNVLRSGAIQTLCFAYYVKGDINNARKYANMASLYYVTVNELTAFILEGEEAVEYCQSNIQSLAELICHNASLMLNKGNFSNEERIRVRQFVISVFDLLYPDGNCGFFHCRYCELYSLMARNNKHLGRIDEMMYCLERASDHAIKFDTIKDGKFTAYMVDRVEIRADDAVKNFVENRCGLLLKMIDKHFSEYKAAPRIIAIENKIKNIAYMG